MRSKKRVLMTGAGAPGGPGILKALESCDKFEIYTCDMNPLASGILLNQERSHVIPEASNSDFVQSVLELCLKNEISVVLPLVTMELFEFSKNKHQFEKHGIKVLVSEYKTLEILNDKARLLNHLRSAGIPHPKFSVARSGDELITKIYDFGYPSVPVVIKPSVGNGSRGIRILDPTIDMYDLLFNHKPNSLHTNIEAIKSAIGENEIPEMVVTEYLPGDELTIDVVVFDGAILEMLIRTRDTMRGGISVSGRFIENGKVSSYVRNIIESLDIKTLVGNIGFQVKKSNAGDFLLLESNPRIQGTSVAGLGCGVNLPLMTVNAAFGDRLEYTKLQPVYFTRYYTEVFSNL